MDSGKKTKKHSARPDDAQSFEKALARLEQIVEQLDEGNVPLARAIALFKEGTELARSCRAMLADAEVQIKEALAETDDGTEAADLALEDEDEDELEGV